MASPTPRSDVHWTEQPRVMALGTQTMTTAHLPLKSDMSRTWPNGRGRMVIHGGGYSLVESANLARLIRFVTILSNPTLTCFFMSSLAFNPTTRSR